jgi:hypothetical protein
MLVDEKFPGRCVEISIVVSVNDRAQRDLIRRFDDTNIDWHIMENQVTMGAEFFCAGKKLRVNIPLNGAPI